jgi:O-antigen ligase
MLLVLAGGVATAARQAPQQTAYVVLGAASLCVLLNAVQFSVGYGMYFVMPRVDLWPEAHFGFANIRHFNQLQTWTLPLLAVPVLVLPKRWRAGKAVVFGLLAFWWMLVIASDGRGTPLAMVVAAIGAGLLFRRTAKSWLGTQLAAVAVGGGLYYLLFTVLAGATPEVVDRLGDAGEYSRRLQHWATSLELAWAQPWLGAGPMHYAWPPYHFDLGAHPHNALMQWLAEWGIPSTLLVLGLVVWGGWRWMKQERDEGRSGIEHAEALRVGLVASVLAGAAHALVSGVIVTPVSQMMLVLVLGWAWGRYRPPSRPERPTVSRRAQVALCTILVASIGITAYHVPDLAAKQERWSAFLESVERNRLSPRYWQQGYFGVRDPGVMERARHDR